MIKHTPYWPIVISLLLAGCTDSSPTKDLSAITDFESNVGWMHGNCLAIKNNDVSKGTQITIVHQDAAHTVSTATVSGRAKGSEDCYPLSEDRWEVNMDNGYMFYAVQSTPVVELGIAVIGKVNNLSLYVFDSCSTSEGISFSLEKRDQNNAKDLWNGYYYLGYDTEVTCDIDSEK